MTISQDIFKGLSENWQWASLSSGGSARVHAERPKISDDNVVVFNKNKSVCARREECDEHTLPQEGLRAEIVERAEPFGAPYIKTDGHGVPLPPAPEYAPENQLAPPEAGVPFEKGHKPEPKLSAPMPEDKDDAHGWADGIAELEKKVRKLKRKLDQIGQRVEFLVEHDHFDHATGLMILTGLPE